MNGHDNQALVERLRRWGQWQLEDAADDEKCVGGRNARAMLDAADEIERLTAALSLSDRRDGVGERDRLAEIIGGVPVMCDTYRIDGDDAYAIADAILATRPPVGEDEVERESCVPAWLAKVFADNQERYNALPLSIKNAQFSHVRSRALSGSEGGNA